MLHLKQKILSEKQSSLSGSLFLESRSGSSGLDRLEKIVLPLEVTFIPDLKQTFHAGINIMHFNTGALKNEDQDIFGDGSVVSGTTHISSLSGIQPYVRYRYETQPCTYEASLSSTPLNSEISETTPNFYLSGECNANPWNYKLKVVQESINDTLLSSVGQKNVQNNQTWGQVFRQGFEGEVAYSSEFITSLTLGYYPTIQGIHTKSNSQVKGSLFTGKKVIENSTTDLLLGPLFVYDKYNFSTNHFTYGHGGYFSPTSFFLASVYGDFSHIWSQNAFMRLKGNIGYAIFEESSQPYFPLDSVSLNSYAGSKNENFSLDLKGYGGYRLNSNFDLLGTVGVSLTPQFNSIFGGISLIYYFDKLTSLNKNTLKRITYAWDKIQ